MIRVIYWGGGGKGEGGRGKGGRGKGGRGEGGERGVGGVNGWGLVLFSFFENLGAAR